jgi:hypothetical protein
MGERSSFAVVRDAETVNPDDYREEQKPKWRCRPASMAKSGENAVSTHALYDKAK